MNSAWTIPVTLLLTFALVATTPAQQPGKGKGQQKKEHVVKAKGQPGKGNAKSQKANPGQAKKANPGQGNGNKGNSGASKGNPGKGEGNGHGNANDHKDFRGNGLPAATGKGRSAGAAHIPDRDVYYHWTPETWSTRNQYRNAGKVTICHKLNSGENPVTINVSSHALQAHLNHGDVQGECPAYNDDRYDTDYWNRRTDYYNFLGQQYDQVIYSRSVLDYALERLGLARQQLVETQNGNYPPEVITNRQLAVTELEQNVSLLEQLLGVAANLVVNKLMN
ncbi:MAG: hypothetical protein ACO1OO_15505 [Flavisolibacter sp.]